MDRDVMKARDWATVFCALILAILWFSVFGMDALESAKMLPGLGITIFTAALFASLIALLGKRAHWNAATVLLLVAIGFLAAIPAVYSNGQLMAFDCLVLLATCIIEICLLSGLVEHAWNSIAVVWESVMAFVRALFSHVATPMKSLLHGGELQGGEVGSVPANNSGEKAMQAKSILLGLLIGCAVLAMALPLLASADSVFGGLIDVGAWLSNMNPNDAWRLVRVLLLAPLLFSLLFAACHDEPQSSYDDKLQSSYDDKRSCHSTSDAGGAKQDTSVSSPESVIGAETHSGANRNVVAIVALCMVDAMYLLFVGVQFVYLFGGLGSVNMAGGYAEYARSGFFQLVAVSAINLAFLMGILKLARLSEKNAQRRAVNILSYILLGATSVILASAAFRMSLYVSVFGMSLLRALTYLGMAFIAVLIAAACIKVVRRDFKFFGVFLAAGLSIWIAFCLSGVDARIASYNVEGYLEGSLEQIDVQYLGQLSPSAMPVLHKLDNIGDTNLNLEVAEADSYWRLQLSDMSWQSWSVDRLEYAANLQ